MPEVAVNSHIVRDGAWPVLAAACVVALAACTALSTLGAAIGLSVAVAVVLFCLPTWLLPSLALLSFALLPVGYLTAVPQYLGRFCTPSVLIMVVWLFRSRPTSTKAARRPALLWGAALLITLLLVLAKMSLNPLRSFLWVAVFILACVLPSLRARRADPRTTAALVWSWLGVGLALSLAAIVESIAGFNPLARYYSLDQHWSVYRVTTLLGHPLMNGTFFAMTACLALFTALKKDAARTVATSTFVLASIAAALSGSRSGVYALVVGLVVGLVILLWSRRVSGTTKTVATALALFAALAIPNLPIFAARAGSAEAAASSVYRSSVLRLTKRLFVSHPFFGGGPGTSAILANRAGASLPLESGILGSLVSLGLVGCVGVGLFLLVLALSAARRGRLEALTPLVAFLVAGAAFPLWETNPSTWVLVGLVALLVVERADPTDTRPRNPGPLRTAAPVRARAEHLPT